VTILLENTAGQGTNLGARLEHLQFVIEQNKSSPRLGLCFDTAHAFEAGFDVSQKKGLDDFLAKADKLFGLDRLKVIHLNDSKTELGSKVDRHQHIGEGFIGKDGISNIINHKLLKDLPFVLETPKKSDADDLKNLKMVRFLRK
jgi:deoxyribonuclease-4